MKWYYRLPATIRIVIVVAAYIPFIVLMASMARPANEAAQSPETMETWQAILMFVFLAIGIFFTVFAVKASKADQFSAKERQEALQREQSALSQRFRQTLAAVPFFTQTEPSITLPAYEMIVGTSVDDRQMNLSESRPGDPLSVIHAPTAKYPNAAKIVNDRTEKILGTVNIDTEKTLLSKFGNGYSLHGSLKEVYSTPAGSTGTIEILSKTE